MKVTDKDYFMNPALIGKLDLCCKRSSGRSKLDNLIIIDGDEGYGKTNMSAACGYYVACKLGRKLDVNHFFFDVDKMIQFAVDTDNQVIIWDEAALGGLSTETYNQYQIKLIKLLMIARKKKHFYFFNIPKIFKLKEYIVDRAIGLIHVYARKEVQLGSFVYFRKKHKEFLYDSWKSSRKKRYKKFYTFHGKFPAVLPKIIDEKEYDRRKDEAIKKGLTSPAKLDRNYQKLITLQHKISQLKGLTKKNIGEQLGINKTTMTRWGNINVESKNP